MHIATADSPPSHVFWIYFITNDLAGGILPWACRACSYGHRFQALRGRQRHVWQRPFVADLRTRAKDRVVDDIEQEGVVEDQY